MDYQSFQPNPPTPQATQQTPPVQKTFTPKLIGLIVLLLILGAAAYGGFWWWQEQSSEVVVPTFTPRVIDPTADWQTYRNEEFGFEFKYPENLKLSEKENEVILNHSIPYENGGDCDMVGGDTRYSNLTDFSIALSLVSGKPKPPYVDGQYRAGILTGQWAHEGAEGCGHSTYYFSLDNGKTLLIKRDAIQALSGISSYWDTEKILTVPGVISKEQSDNLFNQILSTFKFAK